MKIQPIPEPHQEWWQNRPFKCHTNTSERLRDYGKVIKDTGFINGKNSKFTLLTHEKVNYYTSSITWLIMSVIG